MKKLKILQIIILLLIAGVVGYYFGENSVNISWKDYKPSLSVANKTAPTSIKNADFSLFWTAWNKLEANYYDKTKLDAKKMLNGAISGMVESLGDPFTMYLPPAENTNFKQGMAGQFTGIGAELQEINKQITVVTPLVGSPAEKAGLRTGDIILKVDSESVLGWSVNQAVEKIRGPKGTEVILTIFRKNMTKPGDIKIVRDVITVKSVVGWVKEIKDIDKIKISTNQNDKIAYVRLSQFGDYTNSDWLNVINDVNLKMQTGKAARGFILDLRSNPGGYLTDAAFVSSEFLPIGTRVVSEEPCPKNEQNCILNVQRGGLLTDTKTKVIVLINGGSASASEIVSGALRDAKRAILVGDKSFGKGTIQSAEDLGEGAGIHITIAKWLTPNGTWVHGTGLEPDIKVALDEKDPTRDTQLEKAITELLK